MAKIRQFGGVTDASIQALETRRVVEPAEVGEADPVEVEEAYADEPDGVQAGETVETDEPGVETVEEPAGPVDYSKLRKPELQAELERRGGDPNGTATELRDRLAALDAETAV